MARKTSRAPGRLVVIDGTDGTGKTTQAALLVKRLRQEKRRVHVADFPRYGLPSAYFVEQYLNGRYGSARDVDPHAAALFYALDRYDARRNLSAQLAHGAVVVANRYVTASLGHQGGKIAGRRARRRFFRWLDWLEHELLGLPRPDLTVILHVPPALAQRLVDRKGRRAYIRRKRDLHEADLEHLQSAADTYRELARLLPNVHVVECVAHGRLLSPTAIHEKIWEVVQPLVKNQSVKRR